MTYIPKLAGEGDLVVTFERKPTNYGSLPLRPAYSFWAAWRDFRRNAYPETSMLHGITGPAKIYVGGQLIGEVTDWTVKEKANMLPTTTGPAKVSYAGHEFEANAGTLIIGAPPSEAGKFLTTDGTWETPKAPKRERRYKTLWLDPELVLSVMTGLRKGSYLHLPRFVDLPADVEVQEPHYCPERRAFGFALWSAKFDLVPDGEFIPSMEQGAGARVEYDLVETAQIPGLAVRKLSPKAGDIVVMTGPEHARQAMFATAEDLLKKRPDVNFVLANDSQGVSLEQLDPKAMRRAGWVRAVGEKAAPDDPVAKERQRLLSCLRDAQRHWDRPEEAHAWHALESFASHLTHAGVTPEEAIAAVKAKYPASVVTYAGNPADREKIAVAAQNMRPAREMLFVFDEVVASGAGDLRELMERTTDRVIKAKMQRLEAQVKALLAAGYHQDDIERVDYLDGSKPSEMRVKTGCDGGLASVVPMDACVNDYLPDHSPYGGVLVRRHRPDSKSLGIVRFLDRDEQQVMLARENNGVKIGVDPAAPGQDHTVVTELGYKDGKLTVKRQEISGKSQEMRPVPADMTINCTIARFGDEQSIFDVVATETGAPFTRLAYSGATTTVLAQRLIAFVDRFKSSRCRVAIPGFGLGKAFRDCFTDLARGKSWVTINDPPAPPIDQVYAGENPDGSTKWTPVYTEQERNDAIERAMAMRASVTEESPPLSCTKCGRSMPPGSGLCECYANAAAPPEPTEGDAMMEFFRQVDGGR